MGTGDVADRLDLQPKYELGLAGLALLLRLADAGDDAEPGLERGNGTPRNGLVRLAEVLAALRMAHDRALDAELEEHRAPTPRR